MPLIPDTPEYKKAQRQHVKSTKNRPKDLEKDWSPFRAAEKRYKARFPPPDLSSVLDFAPSNSHQFTDQWSGSPTAFPSKRISPVGGANSDVYIVPLIPGLVILPSFLSPQKQRNLVKWSLARHALSPNDTNLDSHYNLPEEGLWHLFLKARSNSNDDILIQPKASSTESCQRVSQGPRQLVENEPASPETFHSISMTPKPPSTPSMTVQPTRISSLLYKLRWANIGWFYHWDSKQYDFSKGKAPIDDELRSICNDAVKIVDWEKVHGSDDVDWGAIVPDWGTWSESYEPDAGIVNFYQEKDTLMAHVDRSEVCATSPLVSISLGNSAIFLIGGLTRESEPVPILLRSGDVVIMSGPSCRRAYHGVPRILEGSLPLHLRASSFPDEDIIEEWQPFEEYLITSRININVRQVFPKGFNPFGK